MKSKKISRNEKNILSEDDFKPENIKTNITIRVSMDLLNLYRKEAEKLGIGYQTLMQMKLKESIDNSISKRVERLESVIMRDKVG